MGATNECSACFACVDVAVVRGLDCQVNCHVVELEFVCFSHNVQRDNLTVIWNCEMGRVCGIVVSLEIYCNARLIHSGSTFSNLESERCSGWRFNLLELRSFPWKVAAEASAPSGGSLRNGIELHLSIQHIPGDIGRPLDSEAREDACLCTGT